MFLRSCWLVSDHAGCVQPWNGSCTHCEISISESQFIFLLFWRKPLRTWSPIPASARFMNIMLALAIFCSYRSLLSLPMKEKKFKQQPCCSSQESPYILQLQLMTWRPPHKECLGCQLKMNVNSNYMCSSLILQSSVNLLCYWSKARRGRIKSTKLKHYSSI